MLSLDTPHEPPLRASLRGLRHSSYAAVDIPARLDAGQQQGFFSPPFANLLGLPSSLPLAVYSQLSAPNDAGRDASAGLGPRHASSGLAQEALRGQHSREQAEQASCCSPKASQQLAEAARAGPIFIPATLRSLISPAASSGRRRPAALVRRSQHEPGHVHALLPPAAQQACFNPRAAGQQHAAAAERRQRQVLFTAVSDLHLERRGGVAAPLSTLFSPHVLSHADVLALLGDIGDPLSPAYRSFLTACALAFPLVLVVPGNHEFHNDEDGMDMGAVRAGLAALLDTLPNTVLMHKCAVTLERDVASAAAPHAQGGSGRSSGAAGGLSRASLQAPGMHSTSGAASMRPSSVLASCAAAGGCQAAASSSNAGAGKDASGGGNTCGSGTRGLRRDSVPLAEAGAWAGSDAAPADAPAQQQGAGSRGASGSGIAGPTPRRLRVRVLGTTLWSHIPNDAVVTPSGQPMSRHEHIQAVLHDYKHVRLGGQMLTPADVCALHAEHVAWLARELRAAAAAGLRCAVVSHHVPTQAGTSHPRFAGSLTGPTYSTPLEHLMGNACAEQGAGMRAGSVAEQPAAAAAAAERRSEVSADGAADAGAGVEAAAHLALWMCG